MMRLSLSRGQSDTDVKADDQQGGEDSPYHPLFSSLDADIVLGSCDGTLFRLHSHTLRATSGWFRTMLTLPQTAATEPAKADVLYVSEDARTLEGLFRMLCGLSIPDLTSYDLIEPILDAAEKYDTPGPVSIVRAVTATPALLEEPLRLFALATRHGWEEVARRASTHTLTLDLYAPEHSRSLHRLPSAALLSLFSLHHARREVLRRRLNEPPFVNDVGPATCSACGSSIDYHTWRELKARIILEVDRRPKGDTVLSEGLVEWVEAKRCWEAKCSKTSCVRLLYDKAETFRVIRECIEQLPETI